MVMARDLPLTGQTELPDGRRALDRAREPAHEGRAGRRAGWRGGWRASRRCRLDGLSNGLWRWGGCAGFPGGGKRARQVQVLRAEVGAGLDVRVFDKFVPRGDDDPVRVGAGRARPGAAVPGAAVAAARVATGALDEACIIPARHHSADPLAARAAHTSGPLLLGRADIAGPRDVIQIVAVEDALEGHVKAFGDPERVVVGVNLRANALPRGARKLALRPEKDDGLTVPAQIRRSCR